MNNPNGPFHNGSNGPNGPNNVAPDSVAVMAALMQQAQLNNLLLAQMHLPQSGGQLPLSQNFPGHSGANFPHEMHEHAQWNHQHVSGSPDPAHSAFSPNTASNSPMNLSPMQYPPPPSSMPGMNANPLMFANAMNRNQMMRLSPNPAPIGPNDESFLIHVLRDAPRKGQNHRQAIESLDMVNSHSAQAWKDYYLENLPRIERLVRLSPSANGDIPHAQSLQASSSTPSNGFSKSAPSPAPQVPSKPVKAARKPVFSSSPSASRSPSPEPVRQQKARGRPSLASKAAAAASKQNDKATPIPKPKPKPKQSIASRASTSRGASTATAASTRRPTSTTPSTRRAASPGFVTIMSSTRIRGDSGAGKQALPDWHPEIVLPKPPSRSPTPPTRLVLSGSREGVYKYTEEDREYFVKLLCYEAKKDPWAKKPMLIEKLARNAPHHSAGSWTGHWKQQLDVVDKIFDRAQLEYSEENTTEDEEEDGRPKTKKESISPIPALGPSSSIARSLGRPNYAESSSDENEVDENEEESERPTQASLVGSVPGSDEDAEGETDGDEEEEDLVVDDEELSMAGQPYGDVEMKALAKFVAEWEGEREWDHEPSGVKWQAVGKRFAFTKRTPQAWAEYYRRRHNVILRFARKYKRHLQRQQQHQEKEEEVDSIASTRVEQEAEHVPGKDRSERDSEPLLDAGMETEVQSVGSEPPKLKRKVHEFDFDAESDSRGVDARKAKNARVDGYEEVA